MLKRIKVRFQLTFISVVLLLVSCTTIKTQTTTSPNEFTTIPKFIDLKQLSSNGVFSVKKQILSPNAKGIIADISLILPEYINGLYYRPFSERLAAGNRMEALWFTNVSELSNYEQIKPREDDNMKYGSFILLQKKNGNYFAILPIVSKELGNSLTVTAQNFILNTATYGTQSIHVNAPLFSYAESSNPYEATRKAWELAKNASGVKGNVHWRSEKEYPEPFHYLGWCTWEHYKKNINEKIITNAINDIKSSQLPIRWVLVDDGYLDEENRQLLSFGVDKKKFPNGWKSITSLKDEKIKWMGIWRNFNGYMDGVSVNNTLKNRDEYLHISHQKSRKNKLRMMTKNDSISANTSYDEMTADTKNNSFDILKVAFQSMT